MADNIAIFRINYKSDFILTLNSDAGWETPFCIKFWTGAPSQAYFAGYDGTTYTHCAPVDGDPTKLRVQFDDHHLPIGDLKFQIGYHFTVADFPTTVEDEVLNQASVIIEQNGGPAQVMLDFNGDTAPEIEFSLPAYANEAQRISNEEQRIENEQARISAENERISNEDARIENEQARISAENERISNEDARIAEEQVRVSQEAARVSEFAQLKEESQEVTADANAAAQLANEKAAEAQQKAVYAQTQGDYAKAQGDIAQADHQRAESDHTTATADHTQADTDHNRAESDHTRAESDHEAVEVYVDSLGAFDISAYHATGGVLAKYADLAAALGTNGANIPDDLRKGGMSVKFVQSSDNKYIEARCMAQNFTTDVTQWQGVDDEPTAGSENLVESGGCAPLKRVEPTITYKGYTTNLEKTFDIGKGYLLINSGNAQLSLALLDSNDSPIDGTAIYVQPNTPVYYNPAVAHSGIRLYSTGVIDFKASHWYFDDKEDKCIVYCNNLVEFTYNGVSQTEVKCNADARIVVKKLGLTVFDTTYDSETTYTITQNRSLVLTPSNTLIVADDATFVYKPDYIILLSQPANGKPTGRLISSLEYLNAKFSTGEKVETIGLLSAIEKDSNNIPISSAVYNSDIKVERNTILSLNFTTSTRVQHVPLSVGTTYIVKNNGAGQTSFSLIDENENVISGSTQYISAGATVQYACKYANDGVKLYSASAIDVTLYHNNFDDKEDRLIVLPGGDITIDYDTYNSTSTITFGVGSNIRIWGKSGFEEIFYKEFTEETSFSLIANKSLVINKNTKILSVKSIYEFIGVDENIVLLSQPTNGIPVGYLQEFIFINVLNDIKNNIREYPSYYDVYIEQKTKTINDYKILNQDSDGDAFIFVTDTHPKNNTGFSGVLINTIQKQTGCNIVIHGGDVGVAEKNAEWGGLLGIERSINEFNKTILGYVRDNVFLNCHGNHDYNNFYENGGSWDVFDGIPISNVRCNVMSSLKGKVVFNEDDAVGMYYYCDNDISKIRYIMLDTEYNSVNGGASLGYNQFRWICLTAIMTAPLDYDFVFVSHIPLESFVDVYSEQGNDVKDLLKVMRAINNKRSGQAWGISYDFTDTQHKVIACFAGHVHRDMCTYVDNVLFVVTSCDGQSSLLSPFDSRYDRSSGTINEQVFDNVVVYNQHKDVYCIRFGAGHNRLFHTEQHVLAVNGTIDLTSLVTSVVPSSWHSCDSTGSTVDGFDGNWTILNTILSVSEGVVTALTTGDAFVYAEDANGNKEFFYIRCE